MRTRKTLHERVLSEWLRHGIYTGGCTLVDVELCVRAEYNRLARQVRRLYQTQGQFYGDNICVKLNDVLGLIKQAKQ